MDLNELIYSNLPTTTFAERIKKAKAIAGYTQKSLSEKVGLSLSTINELEAGYRDIVYRDTLLKLLTVLNKNILCDDYCNFILNQEDNIRHLICKYDMKELCNKLNISRSCIERWRDGRYQVSRKLYSIIKDLL